MLLWPGSLVFPLLYQLMHPSQISTNQDTLPDRYLPYFRTNREEYLRLSNMRNFFRLEIKNERNLGCSSFYLNKVFYAMFLYNPTFGLTEKNTYD